MNSYEKLRPQTDIETCNCEKIDALILVDMLSCNPVHCFKCKMEIDPETIKLDEKLVEDIATWLRTFQAIYALWLDSGEYERWAKKRLLDSQGQVNIDGMSIAKQLSILHTTYYWWFYDIDDGTPTNCPSCNRALDLQVVHGTGKCDVCNIIV